MVGMQEFDLNKTFRANVKETTEVRIGDIYQVRRNIFGTGSMSTPVARYFAWRPEYTEGVNPHWRIDCFVRDHKLSGEPREMAQLLTAKLQELGLCDLPIWVSWHKSSELDGEKLGDLWEAD
jgi:hypothetical protein